MTVDELRRALADLPGELPVVVVTVFPDVAEAFVKEPTECGFRRMLGITEDGKPIMQGFEIRITES